MCFYDVLSPSDVCGGTGIDCIEQWRVCEFCARKIMNFGGKRIETFRWSETGFVYFEDCFVYNATLFRIIFSPSTRSFFLWKLHILTHCLASRGLHLRGDEKAYRADVERLQRWLTKRKEKKKKITLDNETRALLSSITSRRIVDRLWLSNPSYETARLVRG